MAKALKKKKKTGFMIWQTQSMRFDGFVVFFFARSWGVDGQN